jgi:hypothetical protein
VPKLSLATQLAGLAQSMIDELNAAGADGSQLDYSEASVASLDGLITILQSSGDAVRWHQQLSMGAYLGEVLIRNIGGRWAAGSTTEPVIFLGKRTIRPVGAVWRRVKEGGSAATDLGYWYEAQKAALPRRRFWQR